MRLSAHFCDSHGRQDLHLAVHHVMLGRRRVSVCSEHWTKVLKALSQNGTNGAVKAKKPDTPVCPKCKRGFETARGLKKHRTHAKH